MPKQYTYRYNTMSLHSAIQALSNKTEEELEQMLSSVDPLMVEAMHAIENSSRPGEFGYALLYRQKAELDERMFLKDAYRTGYQQGVAENLLASLKEIRHGIGEAIAALNSIVVEKQANIAALEDPAADSSTAYGASFEKECHEYAITQLADLMAEYATFTVRLDTKIAENEKLIAESEERYPAPMPMV